MSGSRAGTRRCLSGAASAAETLNPAPASRPGEKRENPRLPHAATIMFENYVTGNYYEGRMVNFSRGGMGFEADFAPHVGAEIFIGIENSPYSKSHDVFRAQVVWTRELSLNDSSYSYGVGVKYC